MGATADERYSPVIYPDPPLGDEELALIYSMWPDAQMTTPVGGTHSVRAKSATRPLEQTAVAISVSKSPDVEELGVDDEGRRVGSFWGVSARMTLPGGA